MKYPLIVFFCVVLFQACDSKKTTGPGRAIAQDSELGGSDNTAVIRIPPQEAAVNQALQEAVCDDTEPGTGAVRCSQRPVMRDADAIADAIRAAEEREAEARRNWEPPGLIPSNSTFASACNNFIQRDGSYGPWGLEMIEAMRSVESAHREGIFFGDQDTMVRMGQRCTSTEHFQSLSRAQQEHIWFGFGLLWRRLSLLVGPEFKLTVFGMKGLTAIIELMVFSSSNTIRVLVMLMAETLGFVQNNTNSQAIRFQARCAASIMADTQGGGYLKNSSSYWLKLRRKRRTDLRSFRKASIMRLVLVFILSFLFVNTSFADGVVRGVDQVKSSFNIVEGEYELVEGPADLCISGKFEVKEGSEGVVSLFAGGGIFAGHMHKDKLTYPEQECTSNTQPEQSLMGLRIAKRFTVLSKKAHM